MTRPPDETEKRLDPAKIGQQDSGAFEWFRSTENQAIFLRNLQTLDHRQNKEATATASRRISLKGRSAEWQSLTLFVIAGDQASLDELQLQIQLRERDIIERYSPEEIRGALTHLREVGPSEIEAIVRRVLKQEQFLQVKCLFVRIEAEKSLNSDVPNLVKRNLQEMAEGEIRALSV